MAAPMFTSIPGEGLVLIRTRSARNAIWLRTCTFTAVNHANVCAFDRSALNFNHFHRKIMAMRRRKGDNDETKQNPPSVWKRAFVSGSKWQEKDEFLDVIYWGRQIVAILCGVIWGLIPLKGFLGIALFGAANAGILYLYFTSFQGVDEEDYGGVWELTKEGFMSSFALFMVVWIIVYSALFFD